MIRKDTVAISMLVLATILSVWLGIWGPTNTTAWKDWQPLMAAFVALGAATLAYRGAMAKVHFDEQAASKTELRKILGIFLRFDFAVDVVRHEAEHFTDLTDRPTSMIENNLVRVEDLVFTDTPEIAEAWTNLDYFPAELSWRFHNLRNEIYNFEQFKKEHIGKVYRCEYGMTPDRELVELHEVLAALTNYSESVLDETRSEISKLRAKMR